MNRFMAMGAGVRAALVAGGALIAAAAGYGFWSANQSTEPLPVVATGQPAPKALADVSGQAEPNVAPDAEEATSAPAATEVPEAAAPDLQTSSEKASEAVKTAPAESAPPAFAAPEVQTVVPDFDVVRVEPDGQTVIAGRAEPGAKVILRLDGNAISSATADEQGEFVALLKLDASPVPRLLTMGSILLDQSEVVASGEVALAPTTAAPVVAVAETSASNLAPTTAPTSAADLVAEAEVASVEMPADAAPDPAVVTEAPAALLVTKDGVNLLQSGQQTAPGDGKVDLAIDTISYTPSGEVQLAGRAAPETQVRVYLDNAPLIDISVADNGRWASTMPMIKPGIYTLRVDALAADGTVTARFETPFKRETQEALAAATQNKEPAVEPLVAAVAAADATPVPPVPEAQAATSDDAAPLSPTVETELAQTTADGPRPASPASITVQPGFTLWGIASEQFGEGILYVQVFEANKDKIRDPDLIYPGQVFVIPKTSE